MAGRSKGFAHLDFATQAHADQAMTELTGVELLGRALRIDHAAKKLDSMNRNAAPPILSVRHLKMYFTMFPDFLRVCKISYAMSNMDCNLMLILTTDL